MCESSLRKMVVEENMAVVDAAPTLTVVEHVAPTLPPGYVC